MAVMLGPAGFGLMGAFTTIADLARTLAEMGIDDSGVRLAESAGSGDSQRIARAWRPAWPHDGGAGLAGRTACRRAFSRQVATLTSAATNTGAPSPCCPWRSFFQLVSDGQGALLQGMRRIGDIARLGVFGALLSAVGDVSVAIVLRAA